MEQKYFMHRIKKDNDAYTKGIEVHDTLDSAIGSFHAYMKQGYNNPDNPNLTFVSCKITDINGVIYPNYNESWTKPGETITDYFLHHIKEDNGAFTKNIDICANIETARSDFHDYMAYGYNNSKFPNVHYVSCMITGYYGDVEKSENWIKPEPTPEPEVVSE